MFICTEFCQDIIEFNEIIQCIFCNDWQVSLLIRIINSEILRFSEWSFYTDFSRIINILLDNINYSKSP